jgi:hypothetical protein
MPMKLRITLSFRLYGGDKVVIALAEKMSVF